MELLQTKTLGEGRRGKAGGRENYVRPEKESVNEMQKEVCRGEHLLGHRALHKLPKQVEAEGGHRKGSGQRRELAQRNGAKSQGDC